MHTGQVGIGTHKDGFSQNQSEFELFLNLSCCQSEQLTRNFAVLVYLLPVENKDFVTVSTDNSTSVGKITITDCFS